MIVCWDIIFCAYDFDVHSLISQEPPSIPTPENYPFYTVAAPGAFIKLGQKEGKSQERTL